MKKQEGAKLEVKHIKRPGVHAKKSSSKLKSSKNYKKSYVGQGKKR